MSNKEKQELAIFNLGKALVELVGEEQAIADLKELWKRHPEMFESEKDIVRVAQIVALEPEIIIKNPTSFSEKDYIAGKKLDEEKMGEIGVRRDENIAKIFHINQKNVKKMGQLERKEVVYKQSMVGTPISYTQAQSLDERLVQKNISSTANEIIPQNEQDSANKEQEINNYNPNDSSAMDMFGKEHFEAEEKAKQETRDKEQDTQSNVRQQR